MGTKGWPCSAAPILPSIKFNLFETPASLPPHLLRSRLRALFVREGHEGHRGCQLLHLGADGKKLGCWMSDDRRLKCRCLLGMSRLANGNGLIDCRASCLHRQVRLSFIIAASFCASSSNQQIKRWHHQPAIESSMKRILTALLALLFLIHAQNSTLKASDARAGNIIAVYGDAAAAPTPPVGWTLQWNERSQIGDSSGYSPLSYDEKAKVYGVRDASGALRSDAPSQTLSRDVFAMPDKNGVARCYIASFKLSADSAGDVWINHGNLRTPFTDGTEVQIFVNEQLKAQKHFAKDRFAHVFQFKLGPLKKDDVIHLAIAPKKTSRKAGGRLLYVIEDCPPVSPGRDHGDPELSHLVIRKLGNQARTRRTPVPSAEPGQRQPLRGPRLPEIQPADPAHAGRDRGERPPEPRYQRPLFGTLRPDHLRQEAAGHPFQRSNSPRAGLRLAETHVTNLSSPPKDHQQKHEGTNPIFLPPIFLLALHRHRRAASPSRAPWCRHRVEHGNPPPNRHVEFPTAIYLARVRFEK